MSIFMGRDVEEFQCKFGMLVHDKPTRLTKRKLEERADFLFEELTEFAEGIDEDDICQQADALIDIVYVALGTAISMGLPWQQLWDDVHCANMRKVRGRAKRGAEVDCVKPEGWIPPKTREILALAGYDFDNPPAPVDDAAYTEEK